MGTEGDGDWRTTFRPDIPSPARMYSYFLGGKDHYPADREAAEQVIAISPEVRLFARQNRAFLRRVVRYLMTECGIRQFIDIGTGLPADGSVHEVAGKYDPDVRVVYVDHDPVVLAHGRNMLQGVPGTAIIEHDLRDPAGILADEELRKLIDFGEPVAVLLVAVLHFIGDEAGPAGLIGQLMEPLTSGSYLALSHVTADNRAEPAEDARKVKAIYDRTTTSAHLRSHREILTLLPRLDLVEPGLVWGPLWRPDPDTGLADDPGQSNMYAVLARKR
jgi:hypothetical protein